MKIACIDKSNITTFYAYLHAVLPLRETHPSNLIITALIHKTGNPKL